MNVWSEKAQIEIQEDIALNNTNKWTTEMKVNLLKLKERERKVMDLWREWNKHGMIYTKIQRKIDNAARFRKDNLLLNLITVRDGERYRTRGDR